ncbi:unnamed protein product [Arctogadus glacialis]
MHIGVSEWMVRQTQNDKNGVCVCVSYVRPSVSGGQPSHPSPSTPLPLPSPPCQPRYKSPVSPLSWDIFRKQIKALFTNWIHGGHNAGGQAQQINSPFSLTEEPRAGGGAQGLNGDGRVGRWGGD